MKKHDLYLKWINEWKSAYSLLEINKGLSHIKVRKASGIDEIPLKALKKNVLICVLKSNISPVLVAEVLEILCPITVKVINGNQVTIVEY